MNILVLNVATHCCHQGLQGADFNVRAFVSCFFLLRGSTRKYNDFLLVFLLFASREKHSLPSVIDISPGAKSKFLEFCCTPL